MRRILLILLLAILPFQMSWATTAAYCQHEQGTAAQHFGHHEHRHQASAADAADKGSAKYHDDCSYHHLSAAKSLCSAVPAIASPPRNLPIAFLSPPFDSHIPDGLIRPDWRIVS